MGYGGQLALSSYNQFRNNCHRDAFIVGICNSVTSVFAGLVVFAILGNLADGEDIKTVVNVTILPSLSLSLIILTRTILPAIHRPRLHCLP